MTIVPNCITCEQPPQINANADYAVTDVAYPCGHGQDAKVATRTADDLGLVRTALRAYRKRRNLSLREFAAELDLDFVLLSKFENGKL